MSGAYDLGTDAGIYARNADNTQGICTFGGLRRRLLELVDHVTFANKRIDGHASRLTKLELGRIDLAALVSDYKAALKKNKVNTMKFIQELEERIVKLERRTRSTNLLIGDRVVYLGPCGSHDGVIVPTPAGDRYPSRGREGAFHWIRTDSGRLIGAYPWHLTRIA